VRRSGAVALPRSLIADAPIIRGIHVGILLAEGVCKFTRSRHLRVRGNRITYRLEQRAASSLYEIVKRKRGRKRRNSNSLTENQFLRHNQKIATGRKSIVE